MAAVLCLVLLPLTAACGFMLGVVGGEATVTSVLGGLTFFMLGGGICVGMWKLGRSWEAEADQPH